MPTRAALALVVAALASGACRPACAASEGEVAAKRAERLPPVTIAAPGRAPARAALLGPDGADPDGYPLRHVDRAGLRALLAARRFDELTRHTEELQAAFEADPRNERWPQDAADAFASAEPELGALLDAWVAAHPASFAPWAARGTHRVAVGFARRGGRYAAETASSDFASMDQAMDAAAADLEKALSIEPSSMAAYRGLVAVAKTRSDAALLARARDGALARCPTCFEPRVTYLKAIPPRWGGSYEQMQAFAAAAPVDRNPKLRLLPGYVALDQANLLVAEKKLDEALAVVEQAVALGEHWEFLTERGAMKKRLGRLEEALADLDRAAALRPQESVVLFDRAWTSRAMRRDEAAARDLLEGLRLEPTDDHGRKLHRGVVDALVRDAWEDHKAGRRADALRKIDLAKELAPTEGEVSKWHTVIVEGGDPGGAKAGGLEALRAAAVAAPDDFRAHQQLDYALARAGRFQDVVAMWDEFLVRHPDHGGAHLERGGALHHLGRRDESLAELGKACELGVSEGCARLRQLGGAR